MAERMNAHLYQALATPDALLSLDLCQEGLKDTQNNIFRFAAAKSNVVDFIEPYVTSEYDRSNLQMYNSANSVEIYRNFLDWLFQTFNVQEQEFRVEILSHLKLSAGMKVLITGCGLGEDIPIVSKAVGLGGEVHAQDISKAMVLESAKNNTQPNTLFTISNANCLPYASGYFDAVFHFGGINLFGDTKKAIAELDRVCKKGGKVVFGDEGVAAHLRKTQYFDVAVCNNKLWAAEPPMDLLPHGALDVQLTYILGNCFYVIGFTSGEGFPYMNIDIPHKGTRGGTARTRYFGQLEGVSAETKAKVYAKARELNISAHQVLEDILRSAL
ncbi:class I SAM-dependent methyltransferase [Curvibacter sp. PAE-UM]|uniref:class I SAM-dependent methyltransferase n=1 Tax=Curvibacter sp. PAE-UM TaxID=1714344 RepID=UPI0009E78638|nr:methyltransferase domain-containing protein [Curvibacter sp. PAE-UM]